MLREFVYALRRLRKSPGFSSLAVLTLALGIGVTTAVFTIVDRVVLQPLSYRDSGQLVILWEKVKFLGNAFPVAGPNPRHADIWQQSATAFGHLALLRHGATGLTIGNQHPKIAGVLIASPDLLNTLGIKPVLGRDLQAGDAVKGHDGVALISYELWQSAFQLKQDVLGQTIRLSDRPLTIVGVLPPQFDIPAQLGTFAIRGGSPLTQVMVPAVIDHSHSYGWNSDYGNWTAIARLNPGITIRQAQAQLDQLQRDIVRQMPADQRDNSRDALLSLVQPLQEAVVGDSRKGLWLLLAAVSGLMLIACVNLANAQLARAVSGEREAAIRSALGASATQILCGSLLESLLLAFTGGAGGLLFASEVLHLLQQLSPIFLPRMAEIRLNGPVLLFTTLLTLSSTLFFGVVPALKLLVVDPQTALQENSNRNQGSRASGDVRRWLIFMQVFACTALLLVTGLLTSSLWHLRTSAKGFNPAQVTAVQVELQTDSYRADQARVAFDDSVLDNIRSLPGIESAALLSALPLEGETWLDSIDVPGHTSQSAPLANWRWISPGYFETVQQALIAGRPFEERDRNLNTVILSRSAAHAVFGSESGLGRQIQHDGKPFTVVGIANDARSTSLKKTPPYMVYVHYKNNPPLDPAFLVRSTLPLDQIAADLRKAIWQRDGAVTIARVKTLDSQIEDSLAPERFQAAVLIAFGLSALLLAMLGIYGVLSYSVATRKQEIGLRIALGADRHDIYSLTLAEAIAPVGGGLVAGWLASLAAGRWIGSFLYGVHIIDPIVTSSVLILFIAAAVVASWIPARRAVSIDPMQALRTE